jgi:ribonuclease P/MRP protein subunit POP5
MTVRPPTLRDKRRYLLVRVDPPGTPIDQKELYHAIADAVTSLFGDVVAAIMVQAVICAEGDRHIVIRCRRGTERELAIALSTITACRDTRIALRIVAASGTIESLRERLRRKAGGRAAATGAVSDEACPAEQAPADETSGAESADNGASVPPAGMVPDSAGDAVPCRPSGVHSIGGRDYLLSYCDGQKVDVIEKGFKNTHRLFLIRSDLEDS